MEAWTTCGRRPAPPLDRFIDDIYCLAGVPRHRRLLVPPMPSAHLFINLGGPIHLYDSDPAVPPAVFADGWFMGVWTRRFVIEHRRRCVLSECISSHGGCQPFVDIPPTELRDRWVPVDAVWERSFDSMRDRIAAARSTGRACRSSRTSSDPVSYRHRAAVSELVNHTAGRLEARWGAVSVGGADRRAGVGVNQLATQFRSHIGVTPKRVARIYRFARLILSVDAGVRGRLDAARPRRRLLRPGPLQQGVQGFHRTHPQRVPGTATPVSLPGRFPAGQRPDARRVIFYKTGGSPDAA